MAKLLPGNSKYKKCCRWGIKIKLIPVVRLLLLHFFFFIFYLNPLHGQITSVNDGDWNSSSTWLGGVVPTALDSVVINNIVNIPTGTTAEVDKLNINPLGHLIVEGSLIINGNLEMLDEKNNYSYFDAYNESIIIVRGNVILSNKTNIGLNSYFIVLGDFSFSNGGGASDFDINDASIYVFGNFDKGGSSLVICNDYDNNTEDYNPDSCHVGTETAFDENDAGGLIPEEIIELVDPCQVSATISGDVEVCHGDLVAYLFFSSATGDEYSIDFDATAEVQGFVDVSDATLSGSEIEITVPESAQPDTYNGELTVTNSTTGCTSEVYNITINIHPLPATGGIIPD